MQEQYKYNFDQKHQAMKKYQLWLQRKSYSQHLLNLVKIKTASTTPQHRDRGHKKTMTNQQEEREYTRLGNVSYTVVNKERRNKKIQLLRSFQVNTQNTNMAKRMRQVKSVVSLHRPRPTPSPQRPDKKLFFANDQLRESKFRQYMKWQSNTISAPHRYFLSIELLTLPRLLRAHHQFAALWCELTTDRAKIRSDLAKLQDCGTHRYRFALEHDLGDKVGFRLFICRGLDSQLVGEFTVDRPGPQATTQWVRSADGRYEVELRMKYTKLAKTRLLLAFK